MTSKKKIEIYSAGCAICDEAIALVKRISCSECDVSVLDINDATVAKKADELGVKSIPAVSCNGKLLDCCKNNGINEAVLKEAGIGKS